jgi:hypothetical protein
VRVQWYQSQANTPAAAWPWGASHENRGHQHVLLVGDTQQHRYHTIDGLRGTVHDINIGSNHAHIGRTHYEKGTRMHGKGLYMHGKVVVVRRRTAKTARKCLALQRRLCRAPRQNCTAKAFAMHLARCRAPSFSTMQPKLCGALPPLSCISFFVVR